MAPRFVPLRLAASAVLVMGLVAAACGDDGGGSDRGLVSGDGYTVLGALAEVPGSWPDEQLLVATGDLAAATDLLGVAPPAVDDADATSEWSAAVTGLRGGGDTVFVPLPQVTSPNQFARLAEIDAELGWSVVDVDAFVEAGSPPHTMTVLAGDLDGSTFDDAEVEEVEDGIVSAGSGEDHETNFEDVTPARPIGAPLRMGVADGRLVASGVTERVRWWLDGPEGTLADDEDFAAAASALDDAHAVAAVLERRGRSDQTSGVLLHGVGWSERDGAAVMTFVYVGADEDAAESLRSGVEQALSEGTSVATGRPIADYVELEGVRVDGRVIVATALATEAGPGVGYRMLVSRDLPFAL